ncbi:imelysin family protein [Tistrella mobilis]|uniref:iron uptake system protein EfeO n=1 Tax=Tistrella mobilis TaxID=171437 RepID=UPI003558D64C
MSGPETSRAMQLAVAGAAVLALAGGAAFWYATEQSRQAGPDRAADQVVTVTGGRCDPQTITLPGGRRSFEIVNASDRPIEWEILDGVMVVAERENIVPGLHQMLTVQLTPGDYEITCGLLSSPRGVLHVTASDEAAAAASEVTLRQFLGPLAEYRVYLVMQGRAAVKAATALRDAIAAGDLDAARRAWTAARLPWRRIEPLAYRIADLQAVIDPQAAYLAGREADPGFIGYHRIEYGLFTRGSIEGLLPVADRLVADLETLNQRLKTTEVTPALLLVLPADMTGRIVETRPGAAEGAFADQDLDERHLAELEASLDGIAKLTGLLGQIVSVADPALEAELTAALDRVAGDLARLRKADAATAAAGEGRAALTRDLAALKTTLGKLPPVIGMS